MHKNIKEKPKKGAVFVKKTAKKKILRKKVKLAVKIGAKTDKIANSAHIVEIEKKLNLEKEIKAEKIINQAKTKQPRIISEKQEKDKQLIMWSGITFFMILIMFVWVYQIKNSIKQTKLTDNNQKTDEWQEVFSGFEENISGLKTNLEKVKEFSEKSNVQTDNKMNDEMIEKIKNNIASSSTARISDIASSTSATSSKLIIDN